MPSWMLRSYIEQMPRVRAEQQLAAMNAAAFPWMSSAAQRDTMRDLNRDLGRTHKPAKATAADLAAIGIPVVLVKTPKTKDVPEG